VGKRKDQPTTTLREEVWEGKVKGFEEGGRGEGGRAAVST
jgi:hypothetical protein